MLTFFILFLMNIIIFMDFRSVRADAGWGPWSKWRCSATCGGGTGMRTRECVRPAANRCNGFRRGYGPCNEFPCPVAPKPLTNKGWTPWMPWECPVTCGGGVGTRSRICEDPDICEGPKEETKRCGVNSCPVDEDKLKEDLQRQIEQQLKTSKHSFVVKQGETVSIPCKDRMASLLDRQYPDAKVTWLRNGEIVEADNDRIKLDKGGDLKVKATVGDNGLWWCSVAFGRKVSATVTFAAFGVQNELPDIVVERGQPFELKCMASSLSRLVKSDMDQKWIHNSSTFRELKRVKPEDVDTFKVPSSNFSNSGIWNCRYSERGAREWTTSVFRVLVVPTKTLVKKFLPIVVSITACLLVIAIIGWLYWTRVKRKRKAEFEYEEDEEDEEGEEYEYFEDEYEQEPLFADQLRDYRNRRDS